MASVCRIYPERLPEKVRREPKLWAEVEMYDALARCMGFGWVVFYDVAWLGKVGQFDAPRDGQTDFIVAHPEKGILLIEVKGGKIRFDGPSRQWISTDREGVDHKISPFSQVRDSKYALRNKLLEQRVLQKCWIELAHAVAFPALPRPEVAVTPDAPPEIIIGRNDMHRLAERIEEVLQYSHGASGHGFRHGPLLVKELTRLVATSIELPNPLAVQAAEEEREMIRLTESQVRMLTLLKRIRRAGIGGGAGSGKTFLAIEKAKRLADEGFRTLLTCYTAPLADFLKSVAGGVENLDVLSVPELCRQLVPRLTTEFNVETERSYSESLYDTMQRLDARPYDALVVDEGQDFTEEWWLALESCLREPSDGIFYVFHDTHQTLNRAGGMLPDGMNEYPLEDNVRNTQTICRTLVKHYRGETSIQARGPVGRKVEVHEYDSESRLAAVLGQVLHRLVERERFRCREIVVLTPKHPLPKSCLLRLGLAHGYRLVDRQPDKGTREILCLSIQDFKGLERPVAIVAELDETLPPDEDLRDALLYVAFSRPRHHLVVVGKGATMETLLLPRK